MESAKVDSIEIEDVTLSLVQNFEDFKGTGKLFDINTKVVSRVKHGAGVRGKGALIPLPRCSGAIGTGQLGTVYGNSGIFKFYLYYVYYSYDKIKNI